MSTELTKSTRPTIRAALLQRHFAIRQEWWTGDALPEAKVVRRELAGVPKIEVVGRSKEKVEELFWDTITQVRADLAGVPRK